MSRALSLDLRVRLLAAVAAGASHCAVAARTGVRAARISRSRGRARARGRSAPCALSGERRSARIEAPRGLILGVLAETRTSSLRSCADASPGVGLGFG